METANKSEEQLLELKTNAYFSLCRFMRRCLNKCGVPKNCEENCRCEAINPNEDDRMKIPPKKKQALCNIMCVDWPFSEAKGLQKYFDIDTVWAKHYEELDDKQKTAETINGVELMRKCASSTTNINFKDTIRSMKDVLEFMLMTIGGLDVNQMKLWLASVAGFKDAAINQWQEAIIKPVFDED